jgi:hypothetical protein
MDAAWRVLSSWRLINTLATRGAETTADHRIAPACSEVRFALVNWSRAVSGQLHSAAPHHLPAFITAPGETDVLLVVTAVILIVIVLIFGNLFLKLHTLPERLAHKGHKLQFEIVAVLGLLALFTHIHAFWVAGLLLALIDLPDFGTPLGRIASSLEKVADRPAADPATATVKPRLAPDQGAADFRGSVADASPADGAAEAPEKRRARSGPNQELIDA